MNKVINKKGRLTALVISMILLNLVFVIFFGMRNTYAMGVNVNSVRPNLNVQLLTPNQYSRPGTSLQKVNGIVIHYTANPGTTAMQNRNYFEGLKDSHETEASSHFIIGLNGEIVQCIPSWEIAYASNHRNGDTISIETCTPDASGAYTYKTYCSMVELTAWLCLKFNLTEKDVIRHYDVTGKMCPKYFVDHGDKWQQFKNDVGVKLRSY